jgi:hypothetical protein
VAALQGIVGARLTGVRLSGPHFASQELAAAALMARPFHCSSAVELELDGARCVGITAEAEREHESWQDREGWESGYSIVATKRRPAPTADTDRARTPRAIDASELPPWSSHIGKTIDRIQLLGERGSGPLLVKLAFLDGTVCVACGMAIESSESFDFRLGEGDELLAASERQLAAHRGRSTATVLLWQAPAA